MAVGPKRRGGVSALREFLGSEAVGGMLLIGAALLALLMVNSPLAPLYGAILHQPVGPDLGHGAMTVQMWINDGMMAVFFLLVGLEIKREWVDGRLASWRQRRLPAIAAGAGMLAPALVYLLAASGGGLARGWAIPAATDIAFAIGVLALLGDRAPASLKLFLTAVAIVDDMGAVAIIALVYTPALHLGALAVAAGVFALLLVLNRAGVSRLSVFLPLAAALWLAVMLSGVHATVAGVLAAFTIPIVRTPGAPDSAESPVHRLEHLLAAPVAWFVLPVFGFANAGVSLAGFGLDRLLAPVPLGVAAGLFVGKQAGVFAAVWLCVRSGIAGRPKGAGWTQIYGVSLLCGIGFTMSLFISTLAFDDVALLDQAKIGILAGSLLSAVAGFLVLRFAPRLTEG
jgi:NhaA family Na+:H+ antiporter